MLLNAKEDLSQTVTANWSENRTLMVRSGQISNCWTNPKKKNTERILKNFYQLSFGSFLKNFFGSFFVKIFYNSQEKKYYFFENSSSFIGNSTHFYGNFIANYFMNFPSNIFIFFYQLYPVILSTILLIISVKTFPQTTSLYASSANVLGIELGNSFVNYYSSTFLFLF